MINNKISLLDLGVISYATAWERQRELFEVVLNNRQKNNVESQRDSGYFIFCEHHPVFTLGKSGSEKNLLINEQMLKAKGIEFFKIDRGGDITFHGPGQIVGYPIFDLQKMKCGVKDYVFKLEEVIIRTLKSYHVDAKRLNGVTGVWIEPETTRARKICAIGIKASRFVSMHGFAFNISTDLGYFGMINPCGFTDKKVTSLKQETGVDIELREVKECILGCMKEVFDLSAD